MANLEELKKSLSEKELEFRNLCDSILLSGKDNPELDKKRQDIKSELQRIKEEILKLEEGTEEEDWETDAESNNMGS